MDTYEVSMKESITDKPDYADFSGEEIDILQEVMNIAFGKASADLAELLDIYVVLSVPQIKVINGEELPGFIHETIKAQKATNIIAQNYQGKFKGNAFLIVPESAGKEFLSLLNPEVAGDFSNILEKEALIEIGNILIGACVSKQAELLSDCVAYSAPRVLMYDSTNSELLNNIRLTNMSAITMKTVFGFEGRDVTGHVIMVSNHESFKWLRGALHTFMEQYA